MYGVSIFLVLLALVLLGMSFAETNTGSSFPSVEGKALTGDKFKVPEDLTKRYNLILVAFQREQQEDIDTWIPGLEELEKAREDFRFYEFPVLPEMNAMVRWFIYQGMRGGITSEEARTRTVTFHLDKERFTKHLGIESEDQIYLFMVNPEGLVLWKDSGIWSEEKERDLVDFISPAENPGTEP
jgi:hypothetical protein